MAAPEIRSFIGTAFSGPGIGFGFSPGGGPQAGDLLIALHSADNGGLSDMAITGGAGGWQTVPGGTRGGVPGGWAGTRISQRIATSSEPSSYTFTQNGAADGVAAILAIRGGSPTGIVVTQGGAQETTDTIQTPAATPPSAGTLALRWAAGVSFDPGGTEVVWDFPSGHTPLFRDQSETFAAAALASRSLVSTTVLPAATFTTGNFVDFWHGFTVLVSSDGGSGSGGPPPDPPTYPAFAPSRGTALYSYTFRRLLDGEFLGSLDLANVTFDKRILQPGTFSATIPIPSRDVAEIVDAAIPRDPADLTSGPGVIVCDIWRAGVPWGEYWITGAKPGRSRRGTPSVALRGCTLDGYLNVVELQADLTYTGVDQIAIARALIAVMQSDPHANIGLVMQSGSSGVPRDRTYLDSEYATVGRRLIELAQVNGGFEWSIDLNVVGGVLQRDWVWGSPRLGTSEVLHDASDADLEEWGEERDALRGGTRGRARGQSAADDDASIASVPLVSSVHEAGAHLAAGWPRIDKTLSRDGVVVQQTLEDYAAYWAATAAGALTVETYTIALGAEPSLTPNSLGDMMRIRLDNEWHLPQSRVRRIIGLGITPTSRQTGKEECVLILEEVADGS